MTTKSQQVKKQSVDLVSITPEMAREWLAVNQSNRPKSARWVNFYLRQMKNGDWQITGDTIKLSTEGKLLDGQHRLHAIVEHGKAVQMYVAYNIDPEAFKVMDTGKRRSSGDIIGVAGYKNPNELGATARIITNHDRGYFSETSVQKTKMSDTELIAWIEQHPEIQEQIQYAVNVYHRFKIGAPPSVLAALYHLFSLRDAVEVDKFFEAYASGVDLDQKNPIRLLRDKLIMAKAAKKRLTLREMLSSFVFTWNAYRMKRELVKLNAASKTSPFPKIV